MGSPDFFARLDRDVILRQSDSNVYRLRGGHRLWAGPEQPAVTYAPDDHACEVIEGGASVRVVGPVDVAGLEKSIRVSLDGERLVVDHRLTNAGDEPREVAPWAITQLRLGGVAELPLRSSSGREGLQADRSLVLWPYTNLTDPRLSFQSDRVQIRGTAGPALKVGSSPDPGKLSYSLDDWCFSKKVEPIVGGRFADRGAVGQVFVKDSFLELETLGPLTLLGQGQSVDHREIWEIRLGVELLEF